MLSSKDPRKKLPPFSSVDPGRFATPVQRLGVSGGTAQFFQLREHRQNDAWIGKDLSHALDEITFYEEVHSARKQPDVGFHPLLKFMFGYEGVLETKVDTAKPGDPPLSLLVLQNLRAGATKLRMLDIKIGEKTADAGWQGKSKLRAMKQSFIDSLTNSATEGFRLEGFDEAPPVLQSIDPLMDIGEINDKKLIKKTHRMMLQTFSATEILHHFLDVHQIPKDINDADLKSIRAPIEVSEIVLREIVNRLSNLAIACRQVPVPQKWIGSSVALAFDAGQLPARNVKEAEICKMVQVCIFDWGRSEFNTPAKHKTLSADDAADRQKFWTSYVNSIDRLAFEAERAYQHRFSSAKEWREVHLTVYDFDSLSENDFLGRVVLQLNETQERSEPLLDAKGAAINGKAGPCTITYSISRRTFPATSRLSVSWRVHIVKAENLPVGDGLRGSSDPFVEIEAVSETCGAGFKQQTVIVPKNLSPTWNETFDLPVLKQPQPPKLVKSEPKQPIFFESISKLLYCTWPSAHDPSRPGVEKKIQDDSLPELHANQRGVDEAFDAWKKRLN